MSLQIHNLSSFCFAPFFSLTAVTHTLTDVGLYRAEMEIQERVFSLTLCFLLVGFAASEYKLLLHGTKNQLQVYVRVHREWEACGVSVNNYTDCL